jgi:putative transcriptional regulator
MNKSILGVVHESAKDLHDADLISNQTMREFDALCLPPVIQFSAEQIQQIRLRSGVSQAVFAAYLNTSADTVRKWEARGRTCKHPNSTAMKLLNMVNQHGIDVLGAKSMKILRQSKKGQRN